MMDMQVKPAASRKKPNGKASPKRAKLPSKIERRVKSIANEVLTDVIRKGRPTAFKSHFVQQAMQLAKLGATVPEMAEIFGVCTRTVDRWAVQNEEFCQALKVGRESADDRVEASLYRKAVGFEFDTEKVFCSKDGEIIRAPVREVVHPDTTSAIFWLKNRRPEQWREKSDLSVQHGFAQEFEAFIRQLNARRPANEVLDLEAEPEPVKRLDAAE